MKSHIHALFLSIFLLAVTGLCAQNTDTTDTDFGKNFVGAKLLFLDYGNPNDIDSLDITNGLEFIYYRNLNPYINIGFPLKAGLANVVDDIDNRITLSADLVVHLQYYKPTARLVPYLMGGAGAVWESVLGANLQFPFGAGLNVRIGQHSFVNLQGEYRLSEAVNRDNIQVGLGFVYRLGLKKNDRDGDGISDLTDECPNLAGPYELGGCPDTDGDGIRDIEDACVNSPGLAVYNGCPDTDGDGVIDSADKCPEERGLPYVDGCPDADGDGVADADDRCVDEAGPADLQGCPDSDGDGIINRLDECPDEAGTVENDGCPGRASDRDGDGTSDDMDQCPDAPGPANTMGCPDTDGDGFADKNDRCPEKAGPYTGCPDTDGDGVIDADDVCPEEPGGVTTKGCPELKEEEKEVLNFAMQAVQFETGSATLKSSSFDILDQIASIMKRYSAYKLRISGHTDNVGDEENNQVLSENRAKACFQYLMSAGIAMERMSYQGFGENKPIATNNNASGRRLNRRVEFDLYVE